MLSHATSEPKAKQFRLWVPGRHFLSPDIRERRESVGYGKTAREACEACIADSKNIATYR